MVRLRSRPTGPIAGTPFSARWLTMVIGPVAILSIAACDVHEPVSIPPGAEVVHVTVTDTEVELRPASVLAGEVYFVLEGPGEVFTLVSGTELEDGGRGPLDEAGVQRVAEGDYQSTTSEPMQVSCGPETWTPERHWAGCGEAFELNLPAGQYAILGSQGAPGVPPVMAVLDVER